MTLSKKQPRLLKVPEDAGIVGVAEAELDVDVEVGADAGTPFGITLMALEKHAVLAALSTMRTPNPQFPERATDPHWFWHDKMPLRLWRHR